MANLAGFFPATVPLAELGLDPLILDAFMLIAELGRANGLGLVRPGFEAGVSAEFGPVIDKLGCCLMAKTNVLLSASLWHCG